MLQSIIDTLQIRLQQGTLLPVELWEQLDEDEYLEYREGPEFDTAWIEAYQQLRREGLTDKELDRVREWCRLAFDQVIRASGSGDLAAYISDDIDLIFCASLLNLDHEFVQWLAECYLKQQLPV